jgi:hypothetical protein
MDGQRILETGHTREPRGNGERQTRTRARTLWTQLPVLRPRATPADRLRLSDVRNVQSLRAWRDRSRRLRDRGGLPDVALPRVPSRVGRSAVDNRRAGGDQLWRQERQIRTRVVTAVVDYALDSDSRVRDPSSTGAVQRHHRRRGADHRPIDGSSPAPHQGSIRAQRSADRPGRARPTRRGDLQQLLHRGDRR